MREIRPLCCICIDRSPPAEPEAGSGAGVVAGALYKWTNFRKGWRCRWFLLRNGVVSYSKTPIRDADATVIVIGDPSATRLNRVDECGRRRPRKPGVVVHLEISSFRVSKSDDKRFYIFSSKRTLYLKTDSREDRAAWIAALASSKNEFSLRSDEVVDLDAAVTHREQLLLNGDFSSLGHVKYNECSTTESSEDVERQDPDDLSEGELCYFDANDSPTESASDYVDAISDVDTVDRRRRLPDPSEKERGVSLWSVIKDNVGKDLTRVCLPVYFNEPLSSLQKCFEDLEYSFLLDKAYEYGTGNSLMRILNVAAFAVSGYASTEGRPCKPFNPLLGETYEADYPEKGVRFLSEKVSHHPMLIACHCEGRGWKFWGESNLKSKFWGRSIQLDPVGLLTLEFDDGEVFQWSKVTTSIYNLILGQIYCNHHGVMHIQGNRQYSCKLTFKEQSFFDRKPHQVEGYVEDVNGTRLASLIGKWSDSMYYVDGDCFTTKKNHRSVQNASLLWKKNKPPTYVSRYNLSSFAITLNELIPELEDKLPPTDSRCRPDQRHLENGEYEKANAEKLRLEKRQRMSRKLQENGWKPRWFQKEGGRGAYRYIGGYWEAREEKKWDGCPDIFSAVSDEASISSFN